MNPTSAMALAKIFEGINLFFNIISWFILAYVIMSWVVRPTNAAFRFVSRIVQPILAPFRPIARKLMQKGIMIDISAILAFFAISLIRNLLIWILASVI